MTLIGLYAYDHSLFDSMQLPDGIDKDLLIDSILTRGGEYEVIYPNPVFLKESIGSWSSRWHSVFERWLKATNDMAEINPLENYDRYEDWTDTNSSKSTDEMHGTGNTKGTDGTTANSNTSGTDTVSAYDSSSLVNNTGTNQSNWTNTNSSTNTDSKTDTMSTAITDGKNTHGGHIHGNIGVTTAGAMFHEFYDIMGKYGNIYDTIATVFLQAFVIPIL